jgi:hypothetical protein
VGDLIELRDPRNPCRRLEPAIGRLIPRPLGSLEDFERFDHLDLPALSRARRALEALRIRTAIGLARDPDRAPPWLLERLRRLEAAG